MFWKTKRNCLQVNRQRTERAAQVGEGSVRPRRGQSPGMGRGGSEVNSVPDTGRVALEGHSEIQCPASTCSRRLIHTSIQHRSSPISDVSSGAYLPPPGLTSLGVVMKASYSPSPSAPPPSLPREFNAGFRERTALLPQGRDCALSTICVASAAKPKLPEI